MHETVRKNIRRTIRETQTPRGKRRSEARGRLRGFLLFLFLSLGEVGGFLLFVALLVSGSLSIVGLAVGLAQSLPLVTELLANLACGGVRSVQWSWGINSLTEADAGVLLADLIAVVIGEEHVSGQTTLGRVGVYVN